VVGAPTSGTGPTVERISPAGIASIKAADPSFQPEAFTSWAASVYERAVGAWQTKDPEPLRPVMAEAVWDRYAQYLLTVGTLPIARTLMGAARATPTFDGAAADGTSQSAMVSFTVVTDAPISPLWMLSDSARTWQERWLFQRAASSHTHASGAVAVCPVCGAPADPGESGRCRFCHADITTRTAGWLVTEMATTMHGAARMAEHLAERERGAAPAAGSAAPVQPPRASPLQPPRA
jgi:hypothetical protein